MDEQIRTRTVLQVVLLRTLSEHPEGLSISGAYDSIHDRYDFPEEWYREIPREQFALVPWTEHRK